MKTFGHNMPLRIMRVTPELLAQMGKGKFEVIGDGLPEDTEVVQAGTETANNGQRLFYIIVKSEEFKPIPAGEDIPDQPAPIIRKINEPTPAKAVTGPAENKAVKAPANTK